jgi:hypothetical protein
MMRKHGRPPMGGMLVGRIPLRLGGRYGFVGGLQSAERRDCAADAATANEAFISAPVGLKKKCRSVIYALAASGVSMNQIDASVTFDEPSRT